MKRKFPGGSNLIGKEYLRYLPAVSILILFFLFSSGYSKEEPIRSGPVDPEIREFLRWVNAQRDNIGCPELKWDDLIAVVALNHSQDMVSRNFFSHTNPDRKEPFDRREEANLDFSAAAENIASGPKTGKEVFEIWLNNPSRRKNMLDCRFTRHGVGRAEGRWTRFLTRP
ncbi:MAG: CAP domain-containing protein [Thermodesulfobacteriota bacterium]|jgi:uncharacterized protein YkwD